MQIINQAIEKFQHMQDELCPPLFAMLREINALEKEFREQAAQIYAQYINDSVEHCNNCDTVWHREAFNCFLHFTPQTQLSPESSQQYAD